MTFRFFCKNTFFRICASFVLLAALLSIAFPGAAAENKSQSKHTLLNEANTFFNQANELAEKDPDAARDLYEKSILRFERLIENEGIRNGRLFYNLGNACFLAGDLGRAILNYRRARQYIPNDPNLQQNLAYARSQRIDQIEEPQRTRVLRTLFFWHYDFSVKIRAILFLIVFAALWGAALLRLFMRSPLLHGAIIICALISLCLFLSLAIETRQQQNNDSGVLIAAESIGRKGNSVSYQASFQEPLHAGAEFTILETRGDWHHVRLHDNRECWLPAADVQAVRLPTP